MDLGKIILLIFLIKTVLLLLTIIINKKISYFILVNISSTMLFLIFTSLGDVNLPKYIFSEVCGLGITIIIFLAKYDRNINRPVLPVVINPNVISNSIRSDNFYVINPDNSLALAIYK